MLGSLVIMRTALVVDDLVRVMPCGAAFSSFREDVAN
jgi:hypothetical protein